MTSYISIMILANVASLYYLSIPNTKPKTIHKMMKIIFALRITGLIAVIYQFNACSSFFLRHEPASSGVIDADDPNIQYIGRFNFSNPKEAVYDWPGVYICAKFEGTSCTVRLHDYENEYAVIIDSYAPRIFTPDTSGMHRIANGLTDSIPHTIMIQKRTESLVGKGEFLGFVLDTGRKLLAPEKRPDRRIEFIGNSITSAYGAEGDSSSHFTPQTENASMSYAAITARALHADYHLISYSGRGVVRNYGDSNKVSKNPMPELYQRICFFDSLSQWNFKSWIPQAVVINLGTNDFSTLPHPDKEVFQNAYIQLISRIRQTYTGVTIFCVCGPMITEPCASYIKEVVENQKKKRDNDIFFIEINPSLLNDSDWGADHHPNISGMSKMTDVIVPTIRLYMNW